MRPRRRRLRSVPVLVVLVLLLSGCRLDAAVHVAVERDGSGTLTVELTADRETQVGALASGVDPLGRLVEQIRDVPGWEGGVVTSEEGARTARLTADFAGAEAFNALVAAFAGAVAGPELRPVETARMVRDDDRLTLSGAVDLRPTDTVAELGLTPEEAVARLAETLRYRWTLRLPGEVLDTNADRVEDGLLTWEVPAGERVELHAEGTLPGSRLPLLLGGGVLAGVLSAWWLRRRAAL